VGPGGALKNLDFGAFWDLRKSRHNGQLAFEYGATSEAGGTCPLPQRRTAPSRRYLGTYFFAVTLLPQ